MAGASWKTGIADIGENRIRVRGYDIAEIMGKLSYAETVLLLLTGTQTRPDALRVRRGRAIGRWTEHPSHRFAISNGLNKKPAGPGGQSPTLRAGRFVTDIFSVLF